MSDLQCMPRQLIVSGNLQPRMCSPKAEACCLQPVLLLSLPLPAPAAKIAALACCRMNTWSIFFRSYGKLNRRQFFEHNIFRPMDQVPAEAMAMLERSAQSCLCRLPAGRLMSASPYLVEDVVGLHCPDAICSCRGPGAQVAHFVKPCLKGRLGLVPSMVCLHHA